MPALRSLIDQLALYEPSDDPVVSLYLNLQPDQHGRDNYDAFTRKEFKERLKSYPPKAVERDGLEQDIERIRTYLESDVNRSSNALAVFACHKRGLFEAVQLDAPLDGHRLYIDREPHLYPLARLDDQYPRYAALLLDTNSARLFVFSAGAVERTETLQNVKTRRTSQGGWSQARYQRHTENFHLHHVKEAVSMLESVVRQEQIPKVVLAGDAVVIPLVRDHLAPDVAERIVDITNLDQQSSEREVLEKTLASLRGRDAEDNRARVQRLIEVYRGGGLAVVRPEAVRFALELGQVDELVISASLDKASAPEGGSPTNAVAGGSAGRAGSQAGTAGAAATATISPLEQAAEDLVTKAAQTAARVRFIEDHALLADVGGVGAFLRFRI